MELKTADTDTGKSRLDKIVNIIIGVLGLAMVVYHLISVFVFIQEPFRHLNTHLGFGLLLVFLTSFQKSRKYRPVAVLFLLATLFGVLYVHIFAPELEMRVGLNTDFDIFVGIVIIVVVFEASRLAFGLVLPIVGLLFMAYLAFGHLLTGIFTHLPITLNRAVTFMCIGLEGVYGNLMYASVGIVFYFILFGAVLQAVGAGEFFIEVGKAVGRKVRSGPALTSVMSSSMVASVTGTPAPNIILTGSITIPLMKRAGFKPEVAGAVEATASTGGQIMPPVMGAAAFIMSSITGISYASIMLAAVIPALLYYIPLGIGVQLHALRHNIRGFLGEEVNLRLMRNRAPLFLVPLIIIVWLLIAGHSPMFAASWAILATLAVSFLSLFPPFRSKESPLTHTELWGWSKKIGGGLIQGAILAGQIAAIVALLGTMINAVAMTGLDIKLVSAVEDWSGGNLLLALLLTMFIAMILGCGLPAIAAYLLVAIVVARVLTNMEVSVLQAHFFIFYCSIMGWLTPPVATAPLIAGVLAGAPFLKTCWQAIRLATPGWFIPFMFVLSAPLLGQFDAGPLESFTAILFAIIGLCSLTILVHGQLYTRLNIGQRMLVFLAAAALIGYFFLGQNLPMAVGGIVCLVLMVLWQLRSRRTADIEFV